MSVDPFAWNVQGYLSPVGHVCQGLVYEGRKEGQLTPQKAEFARSASEGERLAGRSGYAIADIQPTTLIGASGRRGTFNQNVVSSLVKARHKWKVSVSAVRRFLHGEAQQLCWRAVQRQEAADQAFTCLLSLPPARQQSSGPGELHAH